MLSNETRQNQTPNGATNILNQDAVGPLSQQISAGLNPTSGPDVREGSQHSVSLHGADSNTDDLFNNPPVVGPDNTGEELAKVYVQLIKGLGEKYGIPEGSISFLLAKYKTQEMQLYLRLQKKYENAPEVTSNLSKPAVATVNSHSSTDPTNSTTGPGIANLGQTRDVVSKSSESPPLQIRNMATPSVQNGKLELSRNSRSEPNIEPEEVPVSSDVPEGEKNAIISNNNLKSANSDDEVEIIETKNIDGKNVNEVIDLDPNSDDEISDLNLNEGGHLDAIPEDEELLNDPSDAVVKGGLCSSSSGKAKAKGSAKAKARSKAGEPSSSRASSKSASNSKVPASPKIRAGSAKSPKSTPKAKASTPKAKAKSSAKKEK